MKSKISKKLKDYEIEIFSKYILDGSKKIKADTEIYCGKETDTQEEVIFKLKKDSLFDKYYIYKEYKIYEILKGIKRIPKVYEVGHQGNYYILITECLGPSLKMLLDSVGGKFTLTTTLKICIQVLDIIKEIHNRGVVLRYLKPGNMVIGKGINKDYIYLIDFEIAKKYIEDGKHIPYSEDKIIKGNRNYISLNTHLGKEISRRDDIECLGYNMIYFMKGELPWSHMEDNEEILEQKMDISLDELCEGLPEEFKELIKYSKKLEFTQEPDYCYLKNLLMKVAQKNGIDIDKAKYDWDINRKRRKIKRKAKNTKKRKKRRRIRGLKRINDNNDNKTKNI